MNGSSGKSVPGEEVKKESRRLTGLICVKCPGDITNCLLGFRGNVCRVYFIQMSFLMKST